MNKLEIAVKIEGKCYIFEPNDTEGHRCISDCEAKGSILCDHFAGGKGSVAICHVLNKLCGGNPNVQGHFKEIK